MKKFRLGKRIVIPVLVVAAVGAAAAYTLAPKTYDTVTLAPQTAKLTFTETGTVAARTSVSVYSLASGAIGDVAVVKGQRVEKGDVIVTLDLGLKPESEIGGLQAQVDAAQIAVRQAEADLEDAKKSESDAQALYGAGGLSSADRDAAVRMANAAQAALDIARANLEARRKAAESSIAAVNQSEKNSEVLAPISGIVKELYLDSVNIIAAGSPVALIESDEGGGRLEVFVSTKDIDGVAVGDRVELTMAGRMEDKKSAGVVEAIDDYAQPVVTALGVAENKVKVTVGYAQDGAGSPTKGSEAAGSGAGGAGNGDGAGSATDAGTGGKNDGDGSAYGQGEGPGSFEAAGFGIGYQVDVDFTYYEEADQIVVPKTALYKDGDAYFVWAVREGALAPVQVEKGLELRNGTVVKSGLAPGDVILQDCNIKGLRAGAKVKL
ncbi:MAG: HlyD family efflux transporter periplasmic adaptor subunit [Lachnospiraceae bacterium]|jgi:multidrug efflux pump subunit AcrA (membrane-fusion protein)|nr:HlyD family efflux transporter periplasmic adaptor subunit [Lachnospiraceae bacterium]